MPTPKWTYNKLSACLNSISEVMYHIKEERPEEYAILKEVYYDMTLLAVAVKKECNDD